MGEEISLNASTDGRYKRNLWPSINSKDDALLPLKNAFLTSMIVGGTSTALGILAILGIPSLGFSPAALADGAIFLLIGWGIKRQNRLAAVAGGILYLAEILLMWGNTKPTFSVLQIFFMLWFIGGIRATFYLRKETPLWNDIPQVFPRLLKICLWGTAIATVLAILVFIEFKANGTILGRAGYKWSTVDVRGQEIFSNAHDYKLSFANTKLEWRRPFRFVTEYDKAEAKSDVAHVFYGYDGLLLSIFEETIDPQKYTDQSITNATIQVKKEAPVTTWEISVPRAITKALIPQPSDEEGMPAAIGVFKSKTKLVTIKFIAYKAPNTTTINTDDILHDMSIIANSFEFTN